MKSSLLLIVFLLTSFLSHAQEYTQSYLDTLEDEALLTEFNKVSHDSIEAEKIARTYLDRARREGDTIKMARGYDRLARIFHPEKNIAFADSIIVLTKDIDHITYPTLGYILKSVENYEVNNVMEAVDDLNIALELSETSNNLTLTLYILDRLVTYKLLWGNKYGALELQKKRHKLLFSDGFRKRLKKTNRVQSKEALENQIKESTINSLFTFTNCYLHLGDVENAEKYLQLFENEISFYKGHYRRDFEDLFCELRIEYLFLRRNYREVITNSERLIRQYKNGGEYKELFDIYCYYGISLMESGFREKGVVSLIKADSIYDNDRIKVLPYRRKVFRLLLNHYKLNGDKNRQLNYLEKIVKFDSVLKLNLELFEPELIRKLETPLLLKDKEMLIEKLTLENDKFKTSNIWIASGLAVALIFLFYYIRMQILYKRRFKALQKTSEETNFLKPKAKQIDISFDVVEIIYGKLEEFEKVQGFLNDNVTLHSLAKKMRTNVNYLSRVINTKKGVTFTNYLHELRLRYAFDKLRQDDVFRKFTIKAIATESGYSSATSFSRAFYKKYGVYPSYYIKRMEAENVSIETNL